MCKWFRNGDREVRTTAKYSMERSGPMQKLIIHNAQFEDEAEYRCVILDNFVSAKLVVKGKSCCNALNKFRNFHFILI